jgi:hypothetical protein
MGSIEAEPSDVNELVKIPEETEDIENPKYDVKETAKTVQTQTNCSLNDCIVCMDSIDQSDEDVRLRGMTLPCDCKFNIHAHCLIRWLTVRGTCPICRKRFVGTEPPPGRWGHGDRDIMNILPNRHNGAYNSLTIFIVALILAKLFLFICSYFKLGAIGYMLCMSFVVFGKEWIVRISSTAIRALLPIVSFH